MDLEVTGDLTVDGKATMRENVFVSSFARVGPLAVQGEMTVLQDLGVQGDVWCASVGFATGGDNAALSVYRTGTLLPAVGSAAADGSGFAAATGGVVSSSGLYTRTGNLVHVAFTVGAAGVTNTAAVLAVSLPTLPVAAGGAGFYQVGTVSLDDVTTAGTDIGPVCQINGATNVVTFTLSNGGAAAAIPAEPTWGCRVALTYIAA